jgi:peptide/nickel transport system permease protein
MLDDRAKVNLPTPVAALRKARGAAAGQGISHEDSISIATQRQLIWWRFRKHKLAMASGVVILFFYLVAFGGNLFAYAGPNASNGN